MQIDLKVPDGGECLVGQIMAQMPGTSNKRWGDGVFFENTMDDFVPKIAMDNLLLKF